MTDVLEMTVATAIRKIDGVDTVIDFPPEQWTIAGNKKFNAEGHSVKNITRKELEVSCTKWLEQNLPDALKPIQTVHLNERGHYMLFQPTSKYQYQTSEKVWAQVKNFVAKCYFVGRNQDDLCRQISKGFYGGTENEEDNPLLSDVSASGVKPKSVRGYLREVLINIITDAKSMDLYEEIEHEYEDDEFQLTHLKTLNAEQLEDMIMVLRTPDSTRVIDVQANPPQSSVAMARHEGDIASDEEPVPES